MNSFLKDKKKIILFVIFGIYMLFMFYFTIFPTWDDTSRRMMYPAFDIVFRVSDINLVPNESFEGRTIYLVPFVSSLKTIADSGLFGVKLIIGNLIMLIPFGFLVPMISQKYNTVKQIVILSLYLILFIESFQFVVGRVAEIDDVIFNLVGSLVGFFIFIQVKKFSEKQDILSGWFSNT